MEPPAPDALLALARCARGRGSDDDRALAAEAGLLDDAGVPTPAGRLALAVLLRLLVRATRRAP